MGNDVTMEKGKRAANRVSRMEAASRYNSHCKFGISAAARVKFASVETGRNHVFNYIGSSSSAALYNRHTHVHLV